MKIYISTYNLQEFVFCSLNVSLFNIVHFVYIYGVEVCKFTIIEKLCVFLKAYIL